MYVVLDFKSVRRIRTAQDARHRSLVLLVRRHPAKMNGESPSHVNVNESLERRQVTRTKGQSAGLGCGLPEKFRMQIGPSLIHRLLLFNLNAVCIGMAVVTNTTSSFVNF